MATSESSRIAIDAPTLLQIVTDDLPIGERHRLVAPNSIRSHALTTLLRRVQAGELTDRQARELHTRLTELKIRTLGDRVSRWVSFQIAREHGWPDTSNAEYLAVAKLQADALVTIDPEMAAKADGIVPVLPIGVFTGDEE